jgi:hypothetical protein
MPGEEQAQESYSPWTIVSLVFDHLAEIGLHPTLGDSGDPGRPASDLLRALGITPTAQGDARITEGVRQELADLRAAVMDDD